MNLLTSIPDELPEELFETLVSAGSVRIERIVSRGHASPRDFWYDQPQDELVVVLRGHARLQFASEDSPRELAPGDWAHIAAHQRHRVEWTTPDEPTVWLAVHYDAAQS